MAEDSGQAPRSLDSVLDTTAWFFSQPHYAGLGPAIRARKPVFRLIFDLARRASRWRLGTFLLILAAYFFYPQMRRPRSAHSVFQFGLSYNNERMFQRLNALMDGHPDWRAEMNDMRIGFFRRVAWFRLAAAWRAAGAVQERRSENPFVTVQLALGAASVLLLEGAYAAARPGLVVVANDHSPPNIAARAVAQASDIPVTYIQHAPVNAFFPPLKFDLSILYDRVSQDHYRTSAARLGVPAGDDRVLLLSPFTENIVPQQERSAPLRVGICLSQLPDEPALETLIDRLSKHPNVGAIGTRRHPRSKTNLSSLLGKPKVSMRPADETLGQFLERYGDLILVPNSGVTVECLHLGHPTFFVPGTDQITEDHYGFQAAGILPTFDLGLIDDPKKLTEPFGPSWKQAFLPFDATGSQSIAQMENSVRQALEELLAQANS